MIITEFVKIKLCQVSSIGADVPFTVDGRVHAVNSRYPGGATGILLRHSGCFVTAVLQPGIANGEALENVVSLTVESLLRVSGTILQSHEGQINGAVPATIKIQVRSLTVISKAKGELCRGVVSHGGPGEVPRPQEMNNASISQRLDDRIIDVRVAATAAIFKLFSGVQHLAVRHLSEHGFEWVASPKLINYQIPGDDDYFEVPYMNGQQARLTQSSEIHLGLAIAADLERVYDIHTVFRREKVISTRHLTEFTLVEVYFALEYGWLELLDCAEQMIIHLVKSLQEREKYQSLIVQANRLYPLAGAFKLGLNEQGRLPRVTFKRAKEILRRQLFSTTDETEDLTREEEAALGRYMASPESSLGPPSDVFVITHYPRSIRPFNFHPSDDDPENTTNSFDIIIRGQECCTSAQFPHSHDQLRAAMAGRDPPIDPDSPEWHAFTAAHEAGMPPWGGYAVGLNRFVQGFLGLQDIHETVLFPRDASRLAP